MTPERLAEIEQLAWHSLLNETPREELRAVAMELADEVRHQSSRIAELEKQNSRFVDIIAASETFDDVAELVDTLAAARERIAVLEDGLRNAIAALLLDLGQGERSAVADLLRALANNAAKE